MFIAICHSMQFSEEAKKVQAWFKERGHEAQPSKSADQFVGLSDEEQERLKLFLKYEHDAMREHFKIVNNADAILVLNYDKNNIPGYIGGNVFLEMGLGYALGKPLYLLNPIPDMPHYTTEIIAMKPIILDGNLEKILS